MNVLFLFSNNDKLKVTGPVYYLSSSAFKESEYPLKYIQLHHFVPSLWQVEQVELKY